MTEAKRGYADLHEHLESLKARGLLVTVDRPIDKDAERPARALAVVGGHARAVAGVTFTQSSTARPR